MKKDSIIISLYAYKFHLFISYLNGEIDIVDLPYETPDWQKPKFPNLLNATDVSTEFQATSNVLFACSSENIFSHDLSKREKSVVEDFHLTSSVPECSQLIIDRKSLFGFSNKIGLSSINIKNPRESFFVSNYIPNIAEKLGELPVSNIDAKNGEIYLSIRNFGLSKVKYRYNHFEDFEVVDDSSNIRFEDPQDIKIHHKKDLIYALDSKVGLAIINSKTDKIEFKERLPLEDLGQEIEHFYGNAVIKGKHGLYFFNLMDKRIRPVLEMKIGTFTTYYNLIFYTNKGKINILKYGVVTRSERQFYEEFLPKFNSIESINKRLSTRKGIW